MAHVYTAPGTSVAVTVIVSFLHPGFGSASGAGGVRSLTLIATTHSEVVPKASVALNINS